MDWIKRNLYFVIGSAVALALMGAAGWFLYAKSDLNNKILSSLNDDYEKLRRLNSQNPHPGSGKIDNIKLAREQQQELRKLIDKGRGYFQRVTPIPDVPKLTDRDFFAGLARTVAQMQRDATNASVILPPGYSFSFEAQKNKVSFASGSLEPLAAQLGEIKAICDVLFQAKINSLDNLRRERVSADDANGPQTDYLAEKSVTNELAVLTPYEVTFRSFSSELAAVLSGFASSPYGLIVKSINVEPGAPAATTEPGAPATPGYVPTPVIPAQVTPAAEQADAAAAFARRYGLSSGGAAAGGVPLRTGPAAPTRYTPAVQAGTAPAGAGPARGGLPTVLDERPLKITLTLNVVKLLPSK